MKYLLVLLRTMSLEFEFYCCLQGVDPPDYLDVRTPLDDYIARPDPSYTWRELNYYDEDECDLYILNMTSQTWKDERWSDTSVWTHYLTIGIPKGANFTHKDAAFMFIGGGSKTSSEPDPDDFFLGALCQYAWDVGTATAFLHQIPNQPIYFTDDTRFDRRRTEDDMIAYTWRRFVENPEDPDVLARMPMTKAGVRAFDTINTFVREKVPDSNITKFMVSGGSKRGWVAWTLAATDRRVVATAPIVLSILNMVPNLMHHYRAYGGWTFAFGDYWSENVTRHLLHPNTQRLADIVDPFAYRERLTMPKVVICATGDEFFLPDDSHFFFDSLPEPKWMMLMENTHHGVTLSEVRVYDALSSFFKAVLTGYPIPRMGWARWHTGGDNTYTGTIRIETSIIPNEVTAWHAESDARHPDRRDFRWATADEVPRLIMWDETDVENITTTIFEASVTNDRTDVTWEGLVVNARFTGPPLRGNLRPDFDFTSEVEIVQDRYEYEPCVTEDECQGELV